MFLQNQVLVTPQFLHNLKLRAVTTVKPFQSEFFHYFCFGILFIQQNATDGRISSSEFRQRVPQNRKVRSGPTKQIRSKNEIVEWDPPPDRQIVMSGGTGHATGKGYLNETFHWVAVYAISKSTVWTLTSTIFVFLCTLRILLKCEN